MGGTALAIIVLLATGAAASAWLLGPRLRHARREFGLRALAGMHWREFQRLMVEALRRQGCEQAHGAGGEHEGLVELRHEGRLRLLSARHGAGYTPEVAAIHEFGRALRLQGAAGGWMTSLGGVTPEMASQARLHGIELLDGEAVWAAVEPVLQPAQRQQVHALARRRMVRGLSIAWGLAAMAAVAAFMLAGHAPRTGPAVAPVPGPGARAEAATALPPPAGVGGPPAAGGEPVPDDPADLFERRRRLAAQIAALPWVDRALWSTQSTLVVHQAVEDGDRDALCALVEAYAELRASRVQLQPPPGSERPVRFFQCRSF